MTLEAFERAQQVFNKLQSSDDFMHAGLDSRGIRIQTDSLIEGIARLSLASTEDLKPPITLMGALIKIASEDHGTYVRVKGGPSWVGIEIRGLVGPMDEDISLEELQRVIMRRSGIYIDVHLDRSSIIGAHSEFLEIDGRGLADIINKSLGELSPKQRDELANQFVNIMADEVAQSGEFLDL